MSGKYNVISIFVGCGGSSLGYKQAGFGELLAIDFDSNAVETFRLNFHDIPIWQRDITTVKANEILKFCNIDIGQLDILDGSPPCQGFSTAGKRKVDDSRNDLFENFIDLIEGLKPKIFVMENVSGMVKGKMKGRFKGIIHALKLLDYRVRCRLLNAKYYGVAQSRERLFFIGVRNDLNMEPIYPKGSRRIISIGEALKEIKPVLYKELKKEWFTFRLWQKMKPGESGSKYHPKDSAFNFVKVDPYRPSPTIPKSLFCANKGFGVLTHWSEPRSLSIEEIKRLSSFPDGFILTGSIEDQWARIGNAVMPMQMYHIAETLKTKILDKIS